jgi:hypothetical protein
VAGNTHDHFSVHPTLGILSIRNSLDFEKKRQHLLTVRVSDGGTPSRNSTAGVTINVDDANDPPVFLQTTYEGKTKYLYFINFINFSKNFISSKVK